MRRPIRSIRSSKSKTQITDFNLQSLGMLDLYETFHESGVYLQADLVTALCDTTP
jgi:hypothetical protein